MKGWILVFALALASGQDFPPIQEPWRCLEQNNRDAGFTRWTMADVQKALMPDPEQNPDCPIVTDDICQTPDFYPYPCKLLNE